jgi:hypothetical protein
MKNLKFAIIKSSKRSVLIKKITRKICKYKNCQVKETPYCFHHFCVLNKSSKETLIYEEKSVHREIINDTDSDTEKEIDYA